MEMEIYKNLLEEVPDLILTYGLKIIFAIIIFSWVSFYLEWSKTSQPSYW